jgi:predicted esterase
VHVFSAVAVVLAVACLSCRRSPQDLENDPAQPRAATCLGPADATTFAVYLHGMDSPTVSDQELGNRDILAHAAAARSIRIALPRARTTCPSDPGARCWGWNFDDAEIDAAATTIADAAQACFGAKPYGVIGFSNGGYLLSKLYRTCRLHDKLHDATWTITFGSAIFEGALEPQPGSLAGCGRIVIVAGTGDSRNFDPTDHLATVLNAKGADVTSLRFEGGHSVSEQPLLQALDVVSK